jgi:predicted DNA-binding transcriptional regulator YafY
VEKYIVQIVEIIYMGKKGKITQRRIEIRSVQNGVVKAFCLKQRGPRIFKIDNILAIQPARKHA